MVTGGPPVVGDGSKVEQGRRLKEGSGGSCRAERTVPGSVLWCTALHRILLHCIVIAQQHAYARLHIAVPCHLQTFLPPVFSPSPPFRSPCPPHAPQRRVVSLVKLLAAAPGSAASLSDDDSLKQLFRAAAGLLPTQSSDVRAVSAAVARATSAANESLELPGSTAAAHVSGCSPVGAINMWNLIRTQQADSYFV